MRRRDFILLLGGAGASWPLAARAQRGRARMGFLSINSPENDAHLFAAFRGSATASWPYRRPYHRYRLPFASGGDATKLAGLAQELIRLKPQVILANSVSPTRAVNRIAPDLPIVCPAFSDGFVPSLATSFARPGGRVTGVATDVESLVGKLAELVFDMMPDATRIGFLSNPAGGSMGRFEQQVKTAAKARGVEVRVAQAEKDRADPGRAAATRGRQGSGRHRSDQRTFQHIAKADRGDGDGFAPAAGLWHARRSRCRRARKLRSQHDQKIIAAPPYMSTRSSKVPRPATCRSNFRPRSSW